MSHHELQRRFRHLQDAETGPYSFQERGGFRVCLVYPNEYHVGMSNLGLQVNLAALGEVDSLTCERAFLPGAEERKAAGSRGNPMVSFDTMRPLGQFNVLAFSITYELDYLNVIRILRMAGIDPRKDRRQPGDPLIIAGGAAVTANPSSMEDIFDLFWIGESEAQVRSFFGAVKDGYQSPGFLQDIAKHPHVFVPGISHYQSVVTSIRQYPLDEYPAVSRIITPHTAFSGVGLMEVTRGCKWPCRFCIARTLYGTVRRLTPETVLAQADILRQYTDKIGLFGAGISDYPDLVGLIRQLVAKGFVVNTSSLRFTCMDDEMAATLEAAGQRTITVAPESFSLKILKKLAKGLNEPYLHRGLEAVLRSKIERVKIYHIVGVPEEGPEDLHKTVEFIQPYARRSNILWELGYSILEPKPHTPFEHLPMASKADVEKSIAYVRKTMHQIGRVKVSYPSFKETTLCDWLCRGDRRVGLTLADLFANDPWEKFQLPYHRYLSDMEEILGSDLPWRILPAEPRLKDAKQVIPVLPPVMPTAPAYSAPGS